MSDITPMNRKEGVASRGKVAGRRDLVTRLKTLWQDEPPDAVAFLQAHPSIRQNRPLALEVAYEEYSVRRDRGEQIRASSFCRRFPSISRSLYRQIEVDDYLRNNPSVLNRQLDISWPRRGDNLLGFDVVEEIGRGAFARAYLCGQPGIGNRQVVVKLAPGGSVEAKTMGALSHPNVMAIHSVEEDEDTKLTGICMPFVGRSTLFDVIDVAFGGGSPPTHSETILEACRSLTRRGDQYQTITPSVRLRRGTPYSTGVLQIALQIALALEHAHERGVLHGDLKPSNIVMSVNGIPMLVDFNLSHSHDSNNLVTGGTLPYMAPEQIRTLLLGADEEDRVDHRSDIYSLGAILHELLTGRVPYPLGEDDEESFAMAGRMLDQQAAGASPCRPTRPAVNAEVWEFVCNCLAFDPRRRPESMRVVVHRLRACLAWRNRTQRWLRQNRRAVIIASLVAASGCAAAAATMALRPPYRDRQFALGVDCYHAGNYHGAIEAFRHAIQDDPSFASAYLARACAALRQYSTDQYSGWLEAAYHDLTLASRNAANPNHPHVISARAYCLIRMNQFDAACHDYSRLTAMNDVDASSFCNYAYCLSKTAVRRNVGGRTIEETLELCTELLERCLEEEPGHLQANLNLAVIELKRFRSTNRQYVPRKGLQAIQQVIKTDPGDSGSYYFAAKLAGIVGDVDGDERLLELCIDYVSQSVEHGHAFRKDQTDFGYPLNVVATDDRFNSIVSRSSHEGRKDATRTSLDRVVMPPVMSSSMEINGTTGVN